MTDSDDKARLYKRVSSVPESFLLHRMRKAGFWPEGEELPAEPPAARGERAALEKELKGLERKQTGDPQALLEEERKRRWDESKARRAAGKAERAERKAARRAKWEAERAERMVHAGFGVSAGLERRESDRAALESAGLPAFDDSAGLAAFLGIPIARLRWLTYHRKGASLVHYHRYALPKKSGGQRWISAPKPELAAAQQALLTGILERVAPEAEAHGFVKQRSIVSNAGPHTGQAVVVNFDLEDFFPSLNFRRVKGLFASFGYSENAATCLALLCTEPPRVRTELEGKVYHVALGQRVLPQGACTSPAITNLICRKLDRRLRGAAKRYGFSYTRYADDLSFSSATGKGLGVLMRLVRAVIEAEGFREHPRKTRVMRRGGRQEVTGITVNDKLTLSRKEMRRLRALLHNAARQGLASQNRENRPNFEAYLRGRVAFAAMVDPERAPALRAALARALEA